MSGSVNDKLGQFAEGMKIGHEYQWEFVFQMCARGPSLRIENRSFGVGSSQSDRAPS